MILGTASAAIGTILLVVVSASGQTDASAAFAQVVQRATDALNQQNLPVAGQLASSVVAQFDAIPQPMRAGQVPTVQRLAREYLRNNLAAEARVMLHPAAASWEATMGPAFPPLAILLADLARAERRTGRLAEAETLVDRARRIRGADPRPADPDAFPIFVELAAIRLERNDGLGAAAVLQQMVAIADGMRGWEFVPNLIDVFETYSAVLTRQGRTAEAESMAARAKRIEANVRAPRQ